MEHVEGETLEAGCGKESRARSGARFIGAKTVGPAPGLGGDVAGH